MLVTVRDPETGETITEPAEALRVEPNAIRCRQCSSRTPIDDPSEVVGFRLKAIAWDHYYPYRVREVGGSPDIELDYSDSDYDSDTTGEVYAVCSYCGHESDVSRSEETAFSEVFELYFDPEYEY